METVNVLAAALVAYVFSAIWYTAMSRHWLVVSGVPLGPDGKPFGKASPTPFVVGAIAYLLVAGMMRHVFAVAGIATPGMGLLAGFGIGAFFITPWVAMNYAFAQRPARLTMLDSVNSIVGCTLMGLVLALF